MDYEDVDGMAEDGDGVHTMACPYCEDITCWCHTSVDYHEVVTQFGEDVVSDDVLAQAYAFFGVDG